jgi:parvulin-like peptidyl-prolyl isomerase
MSARRRLAAALAAGLFALGALGCTSTVAVKVNGVAISVEDVDAEVAFETARSPATYQGEAAEENLARLRASVLDRLIAGELLRQGAEGLGIVVGGASVEERLEALQGTYGGPEEFETALAEQGLDLKRIRDQISQQLLKDLVTVKLISAEPVTDAEVAVYYNNNAAQFAQPAASRVAHILLGPEDESLAKEILAELKGGADFAALAKKHSTDKASAAQGGELGWQTVPGEPEFDAAVAKLKDVGDLSPLVRTKVGWHIIRLAETRTGSEQPLEEVAGQIRDVLARQRGAEKYATWIAGQRASADIQYIREPAPALVPAPSPGG